MTLMAMIFAACAGADGNRDLEDTSTGTASEFTQTLEAQPLGDDPFPTEPGTGSSSCRLNPRRCCDTNTSGKCTRWVSGCQLCP
jgi:hypothetical protein